MTRSHKQNDRDHAGLANGTASAEEHLPRYFAKSGHIDADPNKVKKGGSGKANWGSPGDEAHDYGYTFAQGRRRSNSSTQPGLADFKTKFETREQEPVFEEELHGPVADTEEEAGSSSETLDKESTSGTSGDFSVEEDEHKRA